MHKNANLGINLKENIMSLRGNIMSDAKSL